MTELNARGAGLDPKVVEAVIRAARRARIALDEYSINGHAMADEDAAEIVKVLRDALTPLDDFDADDDSAEGSRYLYGCDECSMATDADGFDRDGYEHAECGECAEVGSGCAAGSLHAEHLQHQVGECSVDEGEECDAPEHPDKGDA